VFAFLTLPAAVAATMNLPAAVTEGLLEASLVLIAATTLGVVLTFGGRHVSPTGDARLRRARLNHKHSFKWDVRDPDAVVMACALFGESGLSQWRDLRMHDPALSAPRRRGGGGGGYGGPAFNPDGGPRGGREERDDRESGWDDREIGWGGWGGGDGGVGTDGSGGGGGGDGGGGGGGSG
jgi:hypothetical protein